MPLLQHVDMESAVPFSVIVHVNQVVHFSYTFYNSVWHCASNLFVEVGNRTRT